MLIVRKETKQSAEDLYDYDTTYRRWMKEKKKKGS